MPIKLDKSKLVKDLANHYYLAPLIDKAFTKFDGDFSFDYSPKEGDEGFHPSSHCVENPLVLYELLVIDNPKRIESNLKKAFLVGHFWHAIIQHLCVLEGFCKPETIEVKKKLYWADKPYHYISGAADICPIEIPGFTGLVDIKSMNSMGFRQNLLPSGFDKKYEAQVNIYMEMFDQDQTIILCVNKDNGEFKEFLFRRNQPLIDAIISKWKYVGECIEKRTPPEKIEWPLPFLGPSI